MTSAKRNRFRLLRLADHVMFGEDERIFFFEVSSESIDEVNRTMLSAGAADGDGEIAAIGASEIRYPIFQKLRDVFEQPNDAVMTLQELCNGRVAPGQSGEPGFPKRVWKTARIEHEVRIPGYSLAVCEGLEQDGHSTIAASTDALANELAQFVHAGPRRVDHEVGGSCDGLQQFSFLADRLCKTETFAAQRMAASSLAISFKQRIVVGAEEHHIAVQSRAAQFIDELGNRSDVARAIARVDADGGLLIGFLAGADCVGDKVGQQPGGDIVDAVVIQVLEHVQRDALTGAGQTAD
jgi:hypothetical protein